MYVSVTFNVEVAEWVMFVVDAFDYIAETSTVRGFRG